MSEEPVRPAAPAQPTREFLLAQALDACIGAERQLPGSAQEIIDEQPGWAQPELRRLLDLACSLDAAATNAIISEDFRAEARARLMGRIARDANADGPRWAIGPLPSGHLVALPSRNGYHHAANSALPKVADSLQRRRWVWRGSAALLAAVVACAATLTASASSLPGEPLYGLKQAHEELEVRLAADDQARTRALLNRADARLDETSRLIQLGRAGDAALAAQQYDQTVQQAATTYAIAVDETPHPPPVVADFDLRLSQQQQHLQSLLQAAPEPARTDLQEALVATQRTRARVADPPPVNRAANQRGRDAAALAAPEPTPAPAEPDPTPVPVAQATAAPTPAPAVPTAVLAQRQDGNRTAPTGARGESRNADEDRGSRGTPKGDDAGDTPADDRAPVAGVTSGAHRAPVSSGQGASSRGSGEVQSAANRGPNAADDRQETPDDNNRPSTPPPAAAIARADTTTAHGGNGGTNANGPAARANVGGAGDDRHADDPPIQAAVAVSNPNNGDGRGRGDTQAKPTVVARSLPTAAPATPAKPAFTNTQSDRGGDGNGNQGRSLSAASATPTTAVQVARPVTPTPGRAQRTSPSGDADQNTERSNSGDGKGRAGGGH